MKGVRVLESFIPTANGAESVNSATKVNVIKPDPKGQAAVTVGAGINIDELNKALAKSGLYAIGAAHSSVSVAGGWSQSGGHAALSSYYGLGSDQMLEYKVVTADGKLLVANAVSNPDMFWALRGGGGGTFGVVVEATMKVRYCRRIFTWELRSQLHRSTQTQRSSDTSSGSTQRTMKIQLQLYPLPRISCHSFPA
jgi:hypothetical protein